MTFDEVLNTNIARELDRANQDANSSRIKLNQLRIGFIELASAYHFLGQVIDNSRHDGAWITCKAMTCSAHREFLAKLELTNK